MARLADELAADAYRRGLWVRETLADTLSECARTTGDRVVIVDGDRRVDCATLHADATACAAALLDRMPVGSVVSFMLPNWYEAAVVYLAATLAGMVVNPILPSLRDHELRFVLADAGSRIIFVPASFGRHDHAAMLSRVVAELPEPPEVVVVRGDPGGHTAYPGLLSHPRQPARLPTLDPEAVRMILYTSGTTGRPKGVLHTHNTLHALITQIGEHWHVEAGDRFLVASPIAHIGGSIYAFECPLLLGTTAVLTDRWDPDAAVRLLTGERCTHMAGATPFLTGLLDATRRAGTRLPDLKVFICGGASVSPELIRRATDSFERAVVTRVYGSSEVPVTTVGSPEPGEADQAADTDGRAGIADIAVGPGGEIAARGPQMFIGYLHPEDDSFDEHGYFRTGDLGRWVHGHYLQVTGRAKDIIIRNGENIAPKEIEDVLAGHPDIAEVAVVGVPDPRTGERACAVIVPRARPGPDLDAVAAYLARAGVAKFKFPERVVCCDELPKNDAGKVLKHRIQAMLAPDASTVSG